MKLLHVAASYLPATRYGGTIVSVHGLCKALAARGHDVHVFATSVNGPSDSNVPHGEAVMVEGVKVWYFRSPYLRRLYYAPAMAAALRSTVASFDLVHTHAIYLWPLWTAARAARGAGVPYVVSPRGMLEKELVERKSPLLKTVLIGFVEKPTIEGAAALHVTSDRERREAEAFGLAFPPICEVPNGVEIPPDTHRSPEPMVLFLGRLNWKKGLDRLIAAMTHAPAARLVIAGPNDGYQEKAEQLVAALGLNSRVSFVGEVHGADKASLLQRASALVLPSYSENFGNVVLEAWAEGCPVIVTPEVGLADQVRDSGGGWVVSGKPEALGRAIQEAVVNSQAHEEAGRLGRHAVCGHFSWASVAVQMEDLYERVRARRGTS